MDVRVGESMTIDVVGERLTVTVLPKSGQRSRLRVQGTAPLRVGRERCEEASAA